MRRLAATIAIVLAMGSAPVATAADNQPPIAVDDPAIPGCNPTGAFGGAYPIVEDATPQVAGVDPGWTVAFGSCSPLANDSDPDGDPLTLELVGEPAHGQAQWLPEGFLLYKPDPDFSTLPGDLPGGDWTSDEVTYRVSDGTVTSGVASYRYWVAPINDAPSFTPGDDIVYAHLGDGAISVPWATAISAGPTNEAHQRVSFEITDLGVTGVPNMFAAEPSIDEDGVLHFTTGSEVGLASVTVRAHDDGGLETYGTAPGWMVPPDDTTDEVTFAIVIQKPPANQDPEAVDDTIEVVQGATGTVAVLANDTDADDDTLSVSGASGAKKGLVEPTADGIRYTAGPSFTGDDSFTYTISDGRGGSDEATVRVTIAADTAPPVIASADRALLRQVVGKLVDVRLSWAATDAATGVQTYRLQERIGDGAWRSVSLPSALSRSATRSLVVGTMYRYRVSAIDRAGNASAWTNLAPITLRRVQQTSSGVRWAGTWSAATDERYSGGSARRTSGSGRKATLTFTGRDIGWVTMRSTIGGRAQVRVDGILVATMDVRGSTTGYRRMVWTRHLTRGGTHTLEIRPLGDGRVTVDAFIILP